jgi:hypothetical protein
MSSIGKFYEENIRFLSEISDTFSVNLTMLNKFDLIKELEKTIKSEVVLNNIFLASQLLNNFDQKERVRYLILKTKKLRKQILDSLNRKLVY